MGAILTIIGVALILGGFLVAFVIGPAAVRKAEAAGTSTLPIGAWRVIGLIDVLLGLGVIVLGPALIQ